MEPTNVLILEDDDLTVRRVSEILDTVGIAHVTFGDTETAWRYLCTHPDIDLLVVRARSQNIDGVEFCRRVRFHHTTDELPVLVLFSEEEREPAGQALAAGATDFIRVPFDPRRFRVKAAIADGTPHRRVDPARGVSEEKTIPHSLRAGNASDSPASGASPEEYEFEQDSNAVRLVVPVFDPASCSLRLPVTDEQIRQWDADPSVQQVELDVIQCCPSCEGLPTFRTGCPCCGSAIRDPDRLIHHYACAHIASEKSFRKGDHLTCPKCLQTRLVAGSDFEIVAGVTACSACEALITQPATICQCLRCNYRFPSDEAVVKPVMGYQVPLSAHRGRNESSVVNTPATVGAASAASYSVD